MKKYAKIILLSALILFSGNFSIANELLVRKNLIGEPSHPYTEIDILYVKLIKAATISLEKQGFKLEGYQSILVSKPNANFYRVTFFNINEIHNRPDANSPSWAITIDSRFFVVVNGRRPN